MGEASLFVLDAQAPSNEVDAGHSSVVGLFPYCQLVDDTNLRIRAKR